MSNTCLSVSLSSVALRRIRYCSGMHKQQVGACLKKERPRCLSKLACPFSGGLSFYFAMRNACAFRSLNRLFYLFKIDIGNLFVAVA